jgi:Nuclear condensing complex subunits, C-term domain
MAEDLDEDEEMVSPSQIAMQLVDWTDPRRLVDLGKSSNDLEALDEDTSIRNVNIHVDLATIIMTHMKKGSSISFLEESNNCRGGTQGIVQYAGQIVYHR